MFIEVCVFIVTGSFSLLYVFGLIVCLDVVNHAESVGVGGHNNI